MCVDPFGGVACTCGSRGCLEVFASATAIVRMTREASPRYPESVLHASGNLSAESIFKAFAIALREAKAVVGSDIPSTKGVI